MTLNNLMKEIGRSKRANARKHLAEEMKDIAQLQAKTAKLYKQERAKGNRAQYAIRNARVRIAWEQVDCGEFDTPETGSVRLRIEQDDSADISNLLCSCGNDHCENTHRARLIDKINRDGVWGIIGEYFDGEDWQHADSCWGFIGTDWKDSGYDIDIMASTLEQVSKVTPCPACGRPRK